MSDSHSTNNMGSPELLSLKLEIIIRSPQSKPLLNMNSWKFVFKSFVTDVGPFLENSPLRGTQNKDFSGLPALITGKPKIYSTNQTRERVKITFDPIHF